MGRKVPSRSSAKKGRSQLGRSSDSLSETLQRKTSKKREGVSVRPASAPKRAKGRRAKRSRYDQKTSTPEESKLVTYSNPNPPISGHDTGQRQREVVMQRSETSKGEGRMQEGGSKGATKNAIC